MNFVYVFLFCRATPSSTFYTTLHWNGDGLRHRRGCIIESRVRNYSYRLKFIGFVDIDLKEVGIFEQ